MTSIIFKVQRQYVKLTGDMTDKWNLRDDLLSGSLLLLSEEDQAGENVRRDNVQVEEELREKASNLSK